MQENETEPPFPPYLTKKQKQQHKIDAYITHSMGAPFSTP
jgi:hypothetical protein